ncbi:MAG: DUF465 domain-containing protein [Mesorhizobium sp.]
MSLASHLAELKKRHNELDQQIDTAMASPSVDNAVIVALKRRKLALKDEIYRLRSDTANEPTRH